MYLEHNRQWNEYVQAQQDLQAIIDEYVVVFQKTQPKISYGEHTQGNPTNKVEEYVIEVEQRQLKRRMSEAQEVLEAKKLLLDIAEEQLRKSRNIYDLIYTKKWVDHKKPKDIYRELDLMGVNYSRSHIYVVINRIREQIQRDF